MNVFELKKSLLRILLIVFFFLLSLGQIQRIQLTSHIAFYLHEVLLAGMTVIFLKDLWPGYTSLFNKIRHKKFLKFFVVFLIVQTVLLQLIRLDTLALSYVLRLILYSQLFFLIKLALSTQAFTKKQLYGLLISMAGLIAVFGFIQYILYPDTRWLIAMGWDDHYYRLISTLFDPGFTGLVIAVGLVLYLKVFADKKSLLFNILFSAVFMAAILLTYSRATYLAVGIVLIYNFICAKNRAIFLIILLFFALIPFLPRPTGEGVRLERTASISARITSNQEALSSLSLTEVIWGRGLYKSIHLSNNQLPDHAMTPDNSFIFLFVSVGMIGLVLALGAIFELRKTLLTEPLASVLMLISIHSLFNNSLFYIWTLAMLASVFALTFSRSEKKIIKV